MSETPNLSEQLAAKISPAMREQLDAARERFGATDGAITRMALEAFLPGYLAAQGRPENVELFAKLATAIDARPELKPTIEKMIRVALREKSAA